MATISDDFSNSTLDPAWTFTGPAGTSSGLGTEGDEAFLTLTTPEGDFNVWRGGRGAALMQPSDNTDFSLETRFLSTPSVAHQMQGFLIAADADNWVRFDTYFDGTTLRAFAAITVGGVSYAKVNVPVVDGAEYLKLDRVGDTWKFSYSDNGATWQTAGSFTHAMTVSSVGVYAGSTTGSGGYTAEIDYFETAAAPLVNEDGVTATNTPPTAVDDSFSTAHDTPITFSAADLVANDSDIDNDTLSITSIGTPSSGTLADNGDGTYTFTPASGSSGTVTFSYTLSDGTATDTANVSIDVASGTPTVPAALVSDDFSGASLGSEWTVIGAAGTSVGVGTEGSEAFLTLTTPEGNYDVYGNSKLGASVAQAAPDEDFTVELRYLSTPSQPYEMQGLLVLQDADSWIRFDIYSNGTSLTAFAAVTVDGVSSAKFARPVSGDASFLKLERAGDVWKFFYSADGQTWTQAGSFTHDMTVTSVGPYAGSTNGSGGFTAKLDYFEVSGDPLTIEDGNSAANAAPNAGDNSFATDIDTPIVITAQSLLANDTDADGDTLSIVSVGAPSSGTLVDNGDGTYTYTPGTGFTGSAQFTYTVSDGTASDTASVSIAVNGPTPQPTSLQSDDFSAATLDTIWDFTGMTGTSVAVGSAGVESYVTLTTPDGNYDVWGNQRGATLLQDTANEDFTVEVKYLSTPTVLYQLQGIFVEQDADSWIRFDTYYDGSKLRAFAATTDNGVSRAVFNKVISGDASFLRLERAGDVWTFSYSADGATWTKAGSFTYALDVTAVGPFSGSTGTGFTAIVDYFETSSDPLQTEDGQAADNAVPNAGDNAFATGIDTPIVITAQELLANDTDADGDTLSITSVGTPSSGTLVDNGDGTYTFTPANGFTGTATFTYTVSDGTATDTATVSIGVDAPTTDPQMHSDDFSGATLDPVWDFVGMSGTGVSLGTAGAESFVTLTTPDGDYNVWGSKRGATLLQDAPDQDFTVDVKFLSTPAQASEMQGIFVQEDADSWMRFDVYSNGTSLRVFAAVTDNGSSKAIFNKPVSGDASYLRLERDGDTWTFSYSADGEHWTKAGSFNYAITVTAVGPFAGSTAGSGGFAAMIDYFETSTDPLTAEDPPNLAPVAASDELSTGIDTAIIITPEMLLANDSDPENDPLQLVSIGSPGSGTIVDNGNGTYTYTPTSGFIGTDVLTYTVSDGQSPDGPSEGTIRINVRDPGSTAPVAADDTATVNEDGSVSINVLANDSDAEGDPLTITLAGDAAHGTVTIDDRGTANDPTDDVLIYTPDDNFHGSDSFSYTIDDGRGYTATATVDVTVVPRNDAPTGQADQFETGYNQALVISAAALLGNDSDIDGDTLGIGSFSQPENGTLVDNGDGTFTYTPDDGFRGTDRFTYSASDGTTTSNPVVVTIDTGYPGSIVSDDFVSTSLDDRWHFEGAGGSVQTVRGATDSYLQINVPAGNFDLYRLDTSVPRIMQDATNEDFAYEAKFLTQPVDTNEFQGLMVQADADTWLRFDLLASNGTLRLFAAVTDNGQSSVAFNFAVADGAATYLKIDRQGDLFTFLYSSDGETWQTAGTRSFQMNVSSVGVFAGNVDTASGYTAKVDYVFNSAAPIEFEDNAPASPVVGNDVYTLDTSHSGSLTIALADLLLNDRDPNFDPLSVSGLGTPGSGSLVDNGDGTITYTAAPGFTGVDHITYTVSDGTEMPDGTGSILIGVDNRAPTPGADIASLDEDTSVVIDLLANDGDPDDDTITITSIGAAAHGTVKVNNNGTVTYTPFANFNGTDTFNYVISDGVLSTTASATVNVAPVEDAPVAGRDTLTTPPGTALTFLISDLLANDSDPDGGQVFFDSFAAPRVGSLAYGSNGSLVYTPTGDFSGLDSFVYTISDESGLTTSQTVDVAVGSAEIDVWYGTRQWFGDPGETQRWVNILGTVDPDTVVSLAYSLNGGADHDLNIGPDTRRLQNPGDFNADIAYSDLDGSSNDDVLTLKATLDTGVVITRDVIIEYESGHRYAPNYSIDWSSVSDLQKVAQVVDGKWAVSDTGLRVQEPGYDRFVTIGDQHWDNYELKTTVTTHDIHSVDPRGRDGGVWGFGAIWDGHTDNPVSGWQPKSGWNPSELVVYKNDASGGGFFFFGRSAVTPFALQEGSDYNVVFRVSQNGPLEHTYQFKIWEEGTSEPAGWLLNRTFAYDQPMTGSIMLLSHYYDVEFGDLQVNEILGNDMLVADRTGGILVGVGSGTGVGEIDTFEAGSGADVMVLGAGGVDYYDDHLANTAGTNDYAFIYGFDKNEDQIVLGGSPGDYVLGSAPSSLPSGQAIYRDVPGGTDELIAIVHGETQLSLGASYFIYDDVIV